MTACCLFQILIFTGNVNMITMILIITRGSLAKKKDNVFAMQKQSVPKGYKGEC